MLTVVSGNQPPVISADSDSVTIDEGHRVTNTGTFSDTNGDSVTLLASVGTVTASEDGTWVWDYTPDDNFSEPQIVTITATDSNNAVATTNFLLTVTNVDPVIENVVLSPSVLDEGSRAGPVLWDQ